MDIKQLMSLLRLQGFTITKNMDKDVYEAVKGNRKHIIFTDIDTENYIETKQVHDEVKWSEYQDVNSVYKAICDDEETI